MNNFDSLSTNQLNNINGGRLRRSYKCAVGVLVGEAGGASLGGIGSVLGAAAGAATLC